MSISTAERARASALSNPPKATERVLLPMKQQIFHLVEPPFQPVMASEPFQNRKSVPIHVLEDKRLPDQEGSTCRFEHKPDPDNPKRQRKLPRLNQQCGVTHLQSICRGYTGKINFGNGFSILFNDSNGISRGVPQPYKTDNRNNQKGIMTKIAPCYRFMKRIPPVYICQKKV